MNQYEVTFIVDPVLSDTEIKQTSENYVDLLKTEGCQIVHVDEMGLRQLAYPIKKRNSGIYYCIEFQSDSGTIIGRLELALRRDERIMRFLTTALDKYGIKYNEDKRNGLIKKRDKAEKKSEKSFGQTAAPVAAKPEEPVQPSKAPEKAPVAAVAEEEE
ncbi:MAG TPA: 30S ribosomal protein S6 [Saprospiraceae bacterium]|nr:30S ribosomal protein S6 [Saprospiraceae bacterium]MCB9271460.1 30S ribosomal protein S6 [Lewinellaceae bacterium]HPG09727.1 30S ribosomal protein S6 [Saprospiraceae bacterium]HQU53925.1 30S ribosomal protein S6 [Saprospiraceae bacterium]HRV87308.1 30S ribosomal protein S6 [Saprospiraceae bacterium]